MIDNEIRIEIPDSTMRGWQEIVDILAEIIGIPACLIMRLIEPYIEVFVSSQSEGNPYTPGDKEKVYGSGLYCERVITTLEKLHVPNALKDDEWKNNPDIPLNMISYLGFPIVLPNGKPFGTLCVLDNQENHFSSSYEKLMIKFRNLIQDDLEIIYVNQSLGDKNKRLTDYLMELQTLRGLNRICANCKSIEDANGAWQPIEQYLIKHPEANFSHSICPQCMKKLYPKSCQSS
ncbi:GAF domain-containing protein [Candidatus Sumerlaeota bacterium]|nr:GAF domain-containing protein [Candidatus Sumerlaeota bacterium]